MTIHNSLSELIGNTPLVKLHHVTDDIKATIAVKVEYFNPGGSSKDRIAERIIDAAERSGQLKPGGVIVEPTSGNTGVGLALVAQQRGYRTIFTLPDKVSESKRAVLRAYGAEVVVTPTDAGPDDPRSYYQVAERLANTIPGGFRVRAPAARRRCHGRGRNAESAGSKISQDRHSGLNLDLMCTPVRRPPASTHHPPVVIDGRIRRGLSVNQGA